jgi:PadR family transcriptional regulator PadR
LLKDGTLYPVLYRLEQAGYIQPRWETQERGIPRKYYQITPNGTRQLETLTNEWQAFSAAVSHLLDSDQG